MTLCRRPRMVPGALLAVLVTGLLYAGAGPASAATTRQIFSPADEAFVAKAHPTLNYAGEGLKAQGQRLIRTYLKFNVSGLSGPPVRAVVALVPEQPSDNGFSTYAAANSVWSEGTVTWDTAPLPKFMPLDSSGPYTCAMNCRIRADVTEAVAGNGSYTFVIESNSYPYDSYASEQDGTGGLAPRLTVTTRTEEEPPAEELPEEEPAEQAVWAPASTSQQPLSDEAAAACVSHRPEQRPGNVSYNNYVPSAAELERFHNEAKGFSPLSRYVTGQAAKYLKSPSTDDLIQWGACKWGIPADWLRAQVFEESQWYQRVVGANGIGVQGKGFGDRRTETLAQVSVNLDPASVISLTEVFSSLGIAQVKWVPASAVNLLSGNPHPGTEPLRWRSTAFNIDYDASVLRYYYDGLCSWCNSTYQSRFVATKTRTAANGWEVIGAWEGTPEPWNGTQSQQRVSHTKTTLAAKPWNQSWF